ncbi:U7 snRNA-associated Sm-like protein LSm11 [Stegostoma tigrinum]|uniref:U7 snRNA-associated Sm-like protein LSm11 n=1 Tax=Stegostoma tigrinum TaxID=3053191 RepID=UPI00202AF2F4|nr:U7 snRNA-associated Sm-like protein LSm11 [Stegostoma tigrinum]
MAETESSEPGPEEDEAGRLNVSSPRFDPYLALYSRLPPPLPFPNVRTFNNIAEYQSFLRRRQQQEPGDPAQAQAPGCHRARGRRRNAAWPPPDPDRIERLKKLMVAEQSSDDRPRPLRRERAPKNVLTRMSLHEGSPLGELYRCVQDRIKVNVHIRTFKGLRGVCSGFLVTFDKFWNMALVDVDETFRKPVLGKAFYNEPVLTVGRLFDRLKLQERSANEEPGAKSTEQIGCLPEKLEGAKAEQDGSKNLTCALKTGLTQATSDTLNPSAQNEGGDLDLSKGNTKEMNLVFRTLTGGKKKQRKKSLPRIDYQQVSQRHVNQLFIRGENVLLISFMQ